VLARFADVFARDWSALNQPDTGPVALAVSGGPDSCALLALGALALPGRVIAATVDHGLRSESADEARQVATLCAARGVPHATVRLQMAAGSGVQARARAAMPRWPIGRGPMAPGFWPRPTMPTIRPKR
jgi:tRNA(Ile)-lysidine synthase